jgi:hypothetical protein
MKTIDLGEVRIDLESAINLARQGPLLLLTADGQEFLMAPADTFEQEVESLRQSHAFQRFLDERPAGPRRIPLDQIEAEIERELTDQPKAGH